MNLPGVVTTCCIYILVQRWVLGTNSRWREAAFAVLNLIAVYAIYYSADHNLSGLLTYCALVVVQYLPFRWWAERTDGWGWVAFLIPILILAVHLLTQVEVWVLAHVVPAWLSEPLLGKLRQKLAVNPAYKIGSGEIGLSFLCFRTSYLVLEVRNRIVKRPGFWAYLGFALFAPTLLLGPISPYSEHSRAFSALDRPRLPVGQSLLRILVGLVKLKFFATILNLASYSSLFFDGVPHGWEALPIAAIAYYLFLYCNFSGFCDIAIGVAGLIGIPVAENFAWPFGARNLREFWNRWHMTLTRFMRDVVFTPLSKWLARMLGSGAGAHAVVLPIIAVFLLIGIWHGVTWPYAVFGLIQAIGLIINHYYSLALKTWLGRTRLAAYNRNPTIQTLAVALTNAYFCASLFFFANDSDEITTILSRLHGR